MNALARYVLDHAIRGPCQCGACIGAENKQVIGHTADLVYFKVSASNDIRRDLLLCLIQTHKGVFAEVNPLDGQEHSYLELGGWVGDQGTALVLMGLGHLLGIWKLMTPRSVLGSLLSDEHVMDMAGSGLITVKCTKYE